MTAAVPKASADRQGELRILHLGRGEGDVVPRVGREQRARLRDRENGQHANQRDGPADADLHRMQRMPSRIAEVVGAEVRGNCLRVAPEEDAQQHQPKQRSRLGDGEDVLHRRAQTQAEDIQHREEDHQQDRGQILRVQADVHVAQNHRANLDWRHMPAMSSSQCFDETEGKNTPRNLPKAMPTAAMVPVWTTRYSVQP